MFKLIRQIFSPKPALPVPAIPAGQRVYAVGDIHGRLDLFTALIAAIEADDAGRDAATSTIILLGDLVDRGPQSAGVIDTAIALGARRNVRVIAGNHEEMFLNSFEDKEILRHFLRFGGRETMLSYPIDVATYREMTLDETQAFMPQLIPAQHVDFLRAMEDRIVVGDYLFVHAGIRPEVPLPDQTVSDLRWIRDPFLSYGGDHGYCVVHGHTITEAAEIRPNRIGIDTGAYMSGRLTALGLQGESRWLIEAVERDGLISTNVTA